MKYYQYTHILLVWTCCVGTQARYRSQKQKSLINVQTSNKPLLYTVTYSFYRKAKFTLANASCRFGFFCYNEFCSNTALEGWQCYIAKYP